MKSSSKALIVAIAIIILLILAGGVYHFEFSTPQSSTQGLYEIQLFQLEVQQSPTPPAALDAWLTQEGFALDGFFGHVVDFTGTIQQVRTAFGASVPESSSSCITTVTTYTIPPQFQSEVTGFNIVYSCPPSGVEPQPAI